MTAMRAVLQSTPQDDLETLANTLRFLAKIAERVAAPQGAELAGSLLGEYTEFVGAALDKQWAAVMKPDSARADGAGVMVAGVAGGAEAAEIEHEAKLRAVSRRFVQLLRKGAENQLLQRHPQTRPALLRNLRRCLRWNDTQTMLPVGPALLMLCRAPTTQSEATVVLKAILRRASSMDPYLVQQSWPDAGIVELAVALLSNLPPQAQSYSTYSTSGASRQQVALANLQSAFSKQRGNEAATVRKFLQQKLCGVCCRDSLLLRHTHLQPFTPVCVCFVCVCLCLCA